MTQACETINYSLRAARRERIKPTGTVQMQAAEASSSGQLVIVAEGVEKSWGEQRILRNFSTRIIKGDRIGIVGASGSGKSTLALLALRMYDVQGGAVLDEPATARAATMRETRWLRPSCFQSSRRELAKVFIGRATAGRRREKG